jgi:hypothetical protein
MTCMLRTSAGPLEMYSDMGCVHAVAHSGMFGSNTARHRALVSCMICVSAYQQDV